MNPAKQTKGWAKTLLSGGQDEDSQQQMVAGEKEDAPLGDVIDVHRFYLEARAPAESMEQSDEKPRKSRKSRRQREGKLRSPDGPDGKLRPQSQNVAERNAIGQPRSVPLQEADHWQLQQHSQAFLSGQAGKSHGVCTLLQLEPESASYASYGWLSYEPVENYWGWDQHAGPRGPPSVSTASPPFSAASWSTAWSTPTAKAASLPLDPTNPWAEDVLQLCEKHGQNVAGRFDLSPVMAGRSSQLVRNCGAVLERKRIEFKIAVNFLFWQDLLGAWADSLGNAVYVSSADASQSKLEAVLAKPPRQDIHLSMRPLDGGWQCGNARLDLSWSSTSKLHWVTADGRVSVWVRLEDDLGKTEEDSDFK
eukprot:g33296.t1